MGMPRLYAIRHGESENVISAGEQVDNCCININRTPSKRIAQEVSPDEKSLGLTARLPASRAAARRSTATSFRRRRHA